MKKLFYQTIALVAITILVFLIGSCNKALDVPYPVNSVSSGTVYNSKSSIDGIMNDLYTNFKGQVALVGIRFFPSYADDGYNPTTSGAILDACTGNTTPFSNPPLSWDGVYQIVYTCNMLLENLPGAKAPGFSDDNKKSYMAAAKAIRAYSYFLLTRIYGDVPLVLSTDVPKNGQLPRESSANVYASIEKDLQDAISDLPAELNGKYYINNKFIPEAMLAEVYLTEGKWQPAEEAANDIINSGNYQLADLNDVFLQSSNEGIFVEPPVYAFFNQNNSFKVGESAADYLFPSGFNQVYFESYGAALSPGLLSSFEPDDQRLVNWVTLVNSGGYPDPANRMFPYKYKFNRTFGLIDVPAGREEEDQIIRLAEIYLIRAESRAELNNLGGAADDLNMIRNRAGLGDTPASSQDDMIKAVLNERRHELFFEGNWRWFDLVRTGKANAVLSQVPYKVNWQPYMVLFPLTPAILSANPNLSQTPGY